MGTEIYEFDPYKSFLVVNILSYIILALLSILLSNGYIVQLARRHPIKCENNSNAITGIMQSIITATPIFFINLFHITSDTVKTLELSYHTILFATAFPWVLFSVKSFAKRALKLSSITHFAFFSLFAFLSCFLGHIDGPVRALCITLIGLSVTYVLKKLMSDRGHPANDPDTPGVASTPTPGILPYLIIPFEVILENIIPIPDMKYKLYSLPMSLKIFFSPIAFYLACLYAHVTSPTIMMIFYTTLGGLSIGTIMYYLHKRTAYGYTLNIYSTIIALLIQHFISSQIIKTAINLSNIFSIPEEMGILFFAAPLISMPAILIQCSFISRGFYNQSLYSLLYFPSLTMCTSNLLAMIANLKNTENELLLTRGMKGTCGTITLLICGILLKTYMCNNRLTGQEGALAIYSMIQNYVITSICSLK